MIGTLIGKIIIFLEKLTKYDASSFPGKFVLKIFPNYLKKIKYPNLIIMVTGSAGKGSTTKLIKDILVKNNYSVCHNVEGSNLLYGITTSIIKNTKFKTLNSDALVLEVDERYLKFVTKYINPTYLIINNITRDQPPRQGSYEEIYEEIKKGITNCNLILNGDDPLLRKYSLELKNKTYFYSINNNKHSFKDLNDIKNNVYCPKCNNRLVYEYYHYSSIGKYKCNNCDFENKNNDYNITNIDYLKNEIIINKKYKIETSNTSIFNLYNILTSFAVCDLIKIDKNKIIETLNNENIEKKIYNEFIVNKRKYTILNCKAENNATYNLSLMYTAIDKSKKTIVLGLNEISRRYNHFDLSWLYDIYFELLKDNNVDKVICVGPYRYDFAVRVKYAGIDEKNIIILENLNNIKNVIEKKTKGNVYGILNFDYVDPFEKEIRKEQ